MTKVLFVYSKRNGCIWSIPKGSKKHYESIKGCAIREVREETGLDISSKIDVSDCFSNKHYEKL